MANSETIKEMKIETAEALFTACEHINKARQLIEDYMHSDDSIDILKECEYAIMKRRAKLLKEINNA